MKGFSLADKFITGVILLLGMAETGHLLMVFGHRPFSDAVILFEAEVVTFAVVMAVWTLWNRWHMAAGRATDGRATGAAGRATDGRAVGAAGRAADGRVTGAAGRAADGRATGATGRMADRKRGTGGKPAITPALAVTFLALCLFILYQIMTITSGNNVDRSGDMTLETVESILETDSVYQVNPLTGLAYTAGVPLRIRILGLPTFYAILCRLADNSIALFSGNMGIGGQEQLISHWLLLTKWVPLCVLLLSYMAFWTLGKALFPEKGDRMRRLLFLTIVSAVLCAGSYAFGMDGFGLLYCGYRGVTLRGTIFLPYTFGLALRHRWKHAILCVLAEACIVWTLYGMGACLAVLLGMGAIHFWQEKHRSGLRISGEED